jgi:type II secretory pathway component PulF
MSKAYFVKTNWDDICEMFKEYWWVFVLIVVGFILIIMLFQLSEMIKSWFINGVKSFLGIK